KHLTKNKLSVALSLTIRQKNKKEVLFLGKVIKSLAIGTIFGVAIGIMVLPELDRKTQRNIRKTRRKIKGVAEDAYDNILDYIN
ncbi:hypothetical protein, partial [Clostridium sp.]|uniref:hypothetical protein n=1 Tax=Clostridium sp. TaxID=1506 RepID=UPI0039A1BD5C